MSKKVAEKYNAIFVLLMEKFDEKNTKNPSVQRLLDGVHPLAPGHELIKREWIKALRGGSL